MSYRPITDTWILARSKVKFYGAYPNGFLERARVLLGIGPDEAVLHLCGGRVKYYPNKRALGVAVTVDVDPATNPDRLLDLADPKAELPRVDDGWPAVLIDPPYTPEDHAKYSTNGAELPRANDLLRRGLEVVRPGGRVGVLHYIWPQPPKTARSVAVVAVLMGFNNRVRCFSVFESAAGSRTSPGPSEAREWP